MKTEAKIGDVITDIVVGDDVTDVMNVVTLSSGCQIGVWNGQASYDPIDSAEGVRIGAKLVSIEPMETHKGDWYLHLKFE